MVSHNFCEKASKINLQKDSFSCNMLFFIHLKKKTNHQKTFFFVWKFQTYAVSFRFYRFIPSSDATVTSDQLPVLSIRSLSPDVHFPTDISV